MSRIKLGWRDAMPILRAAAYDLIADNATSRAAAVAFYAALSFAPLLLLLLSLSSVAGPQIQDDLITELTRLLGPQVGDAMRGVLANVQETPRSGLLPSIIGLVTLLVSATGVFVELQSAMNHIWDVETKPRQPLLGLLRSRLLSLGVVAAIGFLLLISMAASAVSSALMSLLAGELRGVAGLWRVVDIGGSWLLFAVVFAVMFKLLPDVRVATSNVVLGGVVTSALFVIGKLLVGVYIGHSAVVSAYGAAGSLIALLVWVYYSALIVFVGAEITQAWASRRGDAIEPSAHARRRGRAHAERERAHAEHARGNTASSSNGSGEHPESGA